MSYKIYDSFVDSFYIYDTPSGFQGVACIMIYIALSILNLELNDDVAGQSEGSTTILMILFFIKRPNIYTCHMLLVYFVLT